MNTVGEYFADATKAGFAFLQEQEGFIGEQFTAAKTALIADPILQVSKVAVGYVAGFLVLKSLSSAMNQRNSSMHRIGACATSVLFAGLAVYEGYASFYGKVDVSKLFSPTEL